MWFIDSAFRVPLAGFEPPFSRFSDQNSQVVRMGRMGPRLAGRQQVLRRQPQRVGGTFVWCFVAFLSSSGCSVDMYGRTGELFSSAATPHFGGFIVLRLMYATGFFCDI